MFSIRKLLFLYKKSPTFEAVLQVQNDTVYSGFGSESHLCGLDPYPSSVSFLHWKILNPNLKVKNFTNHYCTNRYLPYGTLCCINMKAFLRQYLVCMVCSGYQQRIWPALKKSQ
jgi:hypothetical protein